MKAFTIMTNLSLLKVTSGALSLRGNHAFEENHDHRMRIEQGAQLPKSGLRKAITNARRTEDSVLKPMLWEEEAALSLEPRELENIKNPMTWDAKSEAFIEGTPIVESQEVEWATAEFFEALSSFLSGDEGADANDSELQEVETTSEFPADFVEALSDILEGITGYMSTARTDDYEMTPTEAPYLPNQMMFFSGNLPDTANAFVAPSETPVFVPEPTLFPSESLGEIIVEGPTFQLGGLIAGGQIAGAQIAGAQIAGAQIAVAQIAEAQIAGAQIAGAQIAGAQIAGAQIAGAQIAGAQIAGAQIAGAQITGAQLAPTALALSGNLPDTADVFAAPSEAPVFVPEPTLYPSEYLGEIIVEGPTFQLGGLIAGAQIAGSLLAPTTLAP